MRFHRWTGYRGQGRAGQRRQRGGGAHGAADGAAGAPREQQHASSRRAREQQHASAKQRCSEAEGSCSGTHTPRVTHAHARTHARTESFVIFVITGWMVAAFFNQTTLRSSSLCYVSCPHHRDETVAALTRQRGQRRRWRRRWWLTQSRF